MPNEISIKVRGLDEIERDFKKIPLNLRRKVTIPSLKKGAEIVQKDARRRAPRGQTGNLRRSIILRVSKINNGRRPNTKDSMYRGKRLLGVYIALRSFAKVKANARGNAYYNRFVHDGYNARGKKKPGKALRGRSTERGNRNVRARKFLTKAFKSRARQAVKVAIRNLDRGAQIVVNKLGF